MKNLLVLTFMATITSLSAQPTVLDSLKSLLTNTSLTETARVDLLNEVAYQGRTDMAQSIQYAREALALSKKIDYKKGEGTASVLIANVHLQRLENEKGMEYALSALQIFKTLEDKKGLMDAYLLMTHIYFNLKENDKAEETLNQSLSLALMLKNNEAIARAYNSFGSLALGRQNRQEALRLFTKALSYLPTAKSYPIKVIILCNLSKMHRLNHDTKEAVPYAEEALQIATSLGDTPGLMLAHLEVGRNYMDGKDLSRAENHFLIAEQLALQTGNRKDLFSIYFALIELNMLKGNNSKSHEYQLRYYKVKDSIFTIEKAQQIAELEMKYETEKKEQAIALLEQKATTESLWKKMLLAGLLLTFLSTIVIYRLQKSRTHKAKLLLETQRLLNQQMQEADKIKSHFFTNISHEFRTPLTLILSPVEEKLLAPDISQKDKISLQSVKRSANRLLELVNQLLDLSKLESGFMKLHQHPQNLYSFLIPLFSSFDSMADICRVKYTKDISIPEFPLLFDGDKLEKILTNLLANAFRFSPPGGKVEVKALSDEKEKSLDVILEVKNTSFIPPDALEKIFEPFYQIENTTTHGMPGTGLGLALVKELVKLLGGTLRVTSDALTGTLFSVTLTLEKTDQDIVADTKTAVNMKSIHFMEEVGDESTRELDDTKETILIVEDNLDVRNLIRQSLEAQYNIMEAGTGKEGLELSIETKIDLVISDVMMPVMSGMRLCHSLKNDERTSHIPVILLTARADHESKLEGLRTGADDYITKPFNMEELLARVSNLIAQRKKIRLRYNQRSMVPPHEITVTPLDEQFMQKIIKEVEDNLDNSNLTPNTLAEALGMSHTNLHRKLKSITGFAPGEYVQDYRLRRAALLMEKKAETFSQIAYLVGFNDPSYFTKCFKKKFGKTPKEFTSSI